MTDTDPRVKDLRQQLAQLDIMAKASALTPAEAAKNQAQRSAVLDALRSLGAAPDDGAAGDRGPG